jgi:hypothetical protein
VQRIAAAGGTGVSLISRIFHEQSLYPHHIHRVQAVSPTNHCARAVLCQLLLAKYIVNTQFVARIMFTDAGFIRDVAVNFHNTHIWVNDGTYPQYYQDIFIPSMSGCAF